jgi:hypothetical protein
MDEPGQSSFVTTVAGILAEDNDLLHELEQRLPDKRLENNHQVTRRMVYEAATSLWSANVQASTPMELDASPLEHGVQQLLSRDGTLCLVMLLIGSRSHSYKFSFRHGD